MEKWEEGYYITAMAGSTSSSSLVVMSKGTAYTQQSYKARACAASRAEGTEVSARGLALPHASRCRRAW